MPLLNKTKLIALIYLFAALCASNGLGAEPDAPVVATTAGRVRGSNDNGVIDFLGIPYGGDTSQRRFQPALPPKPWTGVLDAVTYAAIAPQGMGSWLGKSPQSENCLTLNVWTQGLGDGKKRPVLVYLHGGGFDNGSGNQESGMFLCHRGDVVVVTVNHRLGGFGFLYLADLGSPAFADSGNVGLLDIVLALRWVHDNIASFGGDPGCVTLFGESGGGAKCTALMAMPAAHGLFQHVWAMSGAIVIGLPRDIATAQARMVLTAAGLSPDRLSEIQSVPISRWAEAMRGLLWAPVTDGGALPREPFLPDQSPLAAGIPLVIGSAFDETRSLLAHHPALTNLTWETLPAALENLTRPRIGLTPEKIVDEYRHLYPSYSPSDIFFAANTAGALWQKSLQVAEAHASQGGPTYAYCLTWPGFGLATHALDVPLVFDNFKEKKAIKDAAGAAEMADLMADSLIAFARTGNPGTPALPRWPQFELPQRQTMIFNLPPQVASDPRGAERKLFADSAQAAPMATSTAATAECTRIVSVLRSYVGGSWKGSLPPDWRGTPMSMDLHFSPSMTGTGICSEAGITINNRRLPYASGMYAWNSAVGTVRFLETEVTGALGEGSVTLDGTTLIQDFTNTRPDGSVVKGRSRLTRTGENTAELEDLIWTNGALVTVRKSQLERDK
jgi:para-nitrobenzyl esterase